MTEDRNARAETAKAHDDSAMIERAGGLPTPGAQGRAGGELERKIGTRSEEERVTDPEAMEGVDKRDEAERGDARVRAANNG